MAISLALIWHIPLPDISYASPDQANYVFYSVLISQIHSAQSVLGVPGSV
jgi:hypothetical protein